MRKAKDHVVRTSIRIPYWLYLHMEEKKLLVLKKGTRVSNNTLMCHLIARGLGVARKLGDYEAGDYEDTEQCYE